MAASHSKMLSVLGFQYEPERIQENEISPTYYDDVGSDECSSGSESRNYLDVSTWCKCGKCQVTASEKESICCADIDEIK